MFEKVDPRGIICRHFSTLYNKKTDKPNWSEIVFFYIMPLIIIPLLVYYFEHTIIEKTTSLLFLGFAVMIIFLITALMLLTNSRQLYDDSEKYANRVTLIEETGTNISFGILVCFLGIIFSIISVGSASVIVTSLVYYLSVIFVHILLMVNKRIDKIIRG
jgi:predicted cation transporter